MAKILSKTTRDYEANTVHLRRYSPGKQVKQICFPPPKKKHTHVIETPDPPNVTPRNSRPQKTGVNLTTPFTRHLKDS